MTLRTLERLRAQVARARDEAALALRKSADPIVSTSAAEAKDASERALRILDAEIEEKRSRFPSRNQAVAR